MSYEVYVLTDPINQVGMPAHYKWAVGKRTATSLDFKQAFRLKREALHRADLLNEAAADAIDAQKAQHAKTFGHPNARRFCFSGDYIGKFSDRRPRLSIADEVRETIGALVPNHRLSATVGAFERLKAGDFMFVPNAGWLFCVNIPEPCGVCNGHGCAECDPNR